MANFLKLLCFYALFGFPLHAKDFGTQGHTFRIQEEDLLEHLKNKLNAITEKELSLLGERIKKHYTKMAEEPTPVGIDEASEYCTYYFDPTITVAKDILDHQGNVIVQQGDIINPLAISPMHGELLFFDGNNESHIQWARQYQGAAKWILVKGKPLKLEEEEGRSIYFDQFGSLTRKLDIHHIPARVSQDKDTLKIKIEEIPICKSI